MNRGRGAPIGRFAKVAAAQADNALQPRSAIGEIRNRQRAEVVSFNQNDVRLRNPARTPDFDRHAPQSYLQKIQGLGLAPNYPRAFTDLVYGDAGPSGSYFRRTEIFHVLAPPNERVASFPYNKAIAIATLRSSDGRPRYFHTSLFCVGNEYQTVPVGTIQPVSEDTVLRFASGIPTSAPLPPGFLSFGVPLIGTVKFRILVEDESGGRFVDADVIGTRSLNLYGFAVTVFVLIKDSGYEIDRQVEQPGLGPGFIEQTVVAARIVSLMRNDRKNHDNRTITIAHPGGDVDYNVAIPPGAQRVQIYSIDGIAPLPTYFFSFRTSSLYAPEGTVNTNAGSINFNPGQSRTSIYDIPNANIIRVNAVGAPASLFSFTFEVTS